MRGDVQHLVKLAEKTGYKNTKSMEFLRNLVDLIKPEHVLELGTAFGCSAAYMALTMQTKVVTIDNYDGAYAKSVDEVVENMKPLYVDLRVTPLKGNTHESSKVLEKAGIQIHPEIIFMDADHSYNGLINEYNSFLPILPDQHIIIVDDYIAANPDARVFVNDLVASYEFCVVLKDFHWGMAVLCTNSGYLLKVARAVEACGQ